MTDPRKTILVVDDQQENIYLLQVLLTSHKYEVLEAQNGQQALDILEKQSCNLVLLDVMMPGMDGYEVCRRIRYNEKTSHLPVILLTAKRDVESKVRGLDIGANDYVTKPFDRQEILARIRSLLTIEDLKAKLVEAERLAAIGQIAVTLNHEINNPLAAIAGNAELLALMLKDAPEQVKQKLMVIQEQCMRIKAILSKAGEIKAATLKTYIQDTKMIDLGSTSENL